MRSAKWTMMTIAAGFVLLVIVGVLWARYSLANPIIGPDYVVRVITFAMLAAGAIAIAVLATTDVVRNGRAWWRHAVPIALAAAVVMYVYQSSYMTEGGFLVLFRDVIASAVAVALFTLLAAWIARWLFQRSLPATWRTLIVFALTIPFALSMPYVLLMVHCTSGDC
jgi:hypothetical protein